MTYYSTRGEGKPISASAAITRGIAADGGLYVPDSLPDLSAALEELIALPYNERAKRVLAPFLSDFTPEEVAACVDGAYTEAKFGPKTAPVVTLSENTHILELFHGPTCAFKDYALQILPRYMTMAAAKTGGNGTIRILVATSGDTGKAALEGFEDVPGTQILVFYPSDGVSDIQKLQMTTQTGGNVAVCGIRGNFDDAQTGVKRIFGDPEVAARLAAENVALSSANSINIGRLLPQIVYYVSAWCELRASGKLGAGERFHAVVPTGNFGNILAASYARAMGVPIGKLICASNRNDVLADFLATGVYDRNRPFYATESPSMDILISSNLERCLHGLCGADTTRRLMGELRSCGRYALPEEAYATLRSRFVGGSCGFEGTRRMIGATYDRFGYLLDPHTAVAVSVLADYRRATGDETPAVVASTASPYKFADSVLSALGEKASGFDAIERLHALTGSPVPEPIAALRAKRPLHRRVCEVSDMTEIALSGKFGGDDE